MTNSWNVELNKTYFEISSISSIKESNFSRVPTFDEAMIVFVALFGSHVTVTSSN